MLRSITEDSTRMLAEVANNLGIKKKQIIAVVSNGFTVSMLYEDGEDL